MGGRRERVQQYKQQVLRHLRRWLIEGEREAPATANGHPILVEDVRLEAHEDEDKAVILFRMADSGRLHGFRMWVEEPPSPDGSFIESEPEVWANVILTNLQEALLTGSRTMPDAEGIAWVY